MKPPKVAQGPQQAGAAPPVTSPKIKSFSICDFRAFAGPDPETFIMDGKNLLIYGENGAGKSSVFHALDEFFSASLTSAEKRKARLLELENIFPAPGKGLVKVEVLFEGDANPVVWDAAGHPADVRGFPVKLADSRVVNASYKKAALDYRSLLDTNYKHGNGTVNLFDVFVRVLLRDYEVLIDGKPRRLLQLWRRMEPMPQMDRMRDHDKAEIATLQKALNDGIAEAIDLLVPKANVLLKDLGWDDVEIERLEFKTARFISDRLRKNRRYAGCEITPILRFRGSTMDRPQTFLNEARLSAMALAIYFAGRQVCAATLQADTPRLIVLDDVLIGLDHSNRMPVLQMLSKHFRFDEGWQVILITHDRVWYEMVRFYLSESKQWKSVEMYEETGADGTPRPIVKPEGADAIVANLAKAKSFHAQHEYSAAAVHARVALELVLKKLCDRKSIPVRYNFDMRRVSSDDFLSAIESWLKLPSQTLSKPLVDPKISDLKLWRKVVLNPFSHSTPVNLTAGEVHRAIQTVEELHTAFQTHIPN